MKILSKYILHHIYSTAWKFVNTLEFSIFLHNMTQTSSDFHISPESRQRKLNQTSERKIFSLSFIYWDKLSSVTYLCIAKFCESLGLAVNLKVKLESICAEVFSVSAMTIKCQYVTCFIKWTGIYQSLMFVEVNHVTNKGDYCRTS